MYRDGKAAGIKMSGTYDMIQNPILPGFHADPCICRKGDDLYVAVSSRRRFSGCGRRKTGGFGRKTGVISQRNL